jgi:aminoglycoside 6'-N-acetyltransferase I
LRIQKVGLESFETALILMQRFFAEEGFSTSAQEMASSLRLMLASPGSAVFLAYQGQEAVGVATVSISVGIEYGWAAELEDLYVLPARRGQGIASALIEKVCGWCREQGCTTVLVTVTPTGELSHGLMDFYGRRDFVNRGRVILERSLT